MKTFTQRFFKVLQEQDELEGPVGPPPEADLGDVDAATASLDPATDPAAFNDVGDNPAQAYEKEQDAQMGSSLQEWIGSIEGFIDVLNGLDSNSINSQINNAACDSLFEDIARSETKKIARIAQDLRGLSESLKSYLISKET